MNAESKFTMASGRRFFRNIIEKLLKKTHDYYFCHIPNRIGFFITAILRMFYSGIKIDSHQVEAIKAIPEDAILIYANKYKSYFDFLFCYTRYKQKKLPYPQIGFDYKILSLQPVSKWFRIILANFDYFFKHWSLLNPYKTGYIRRALLDDQVGFVSLVEKKGFYRRSVKRKTDPIQYLIEMQSTTERPIIILPQLMIFSKKAHKAYPTLIDIFFGPEEHPGKIRRLVNLFKNPGKVFVEVSESLNLKEYINLPENQKLSIRQMSLNLRQHLTDQVNKHRQSITGPVLKSRVEIKQDILTNDRLQNFMQIHARENEMPVYQVYKKADECLEEIAAKYSNLVLKCLDILLGWIFNTIFEGITVNTEVLNRIKSMSKKGPLILMPCHKSHIDYLILSYLFYNNNMPCPHIAAGKNMSFWPMGTIFRNAGAFFLRRSFKGQELYAKVFNEYIFKLLEEGFNIEFFIEGGRSRTGKLLRPKYGFLNMLLDAYKKGACKDMIFVPIYIGYDRVIEEGAYIHEIEGGKKEPESFKQVIQARKFLKKRYGRIYVQFNEPISFQDYLESNNIDLSDLDHQQERDLSSALGYRFLSAIDLVSVVTPHALVASAILNCSRKRFSYQHILDHLETYMNFLITQPIKLTDTLLMDNEHTFKHVLESYTQRKFIENYSDDEDMQGTDMLFKVNENKRPALEYYKNNAVSLFIPAAFTALAILQRDAFQFATADLHQSYSFLRQLFKYEFAYNVEKSSEYFVRKSIKAFIDEAILIPHPTLPDTYNITSNGYRKLKLFANFLRPYFESYWVTLNFIKRYPANSFEGKAKIKKLQSLGFRMYKKKEIERKEALSKVNFKNALDFFERRGIVDPDDSKIDIYTEAIRQYINCLPS